LLHAAEVARLHWQIAKVPLCLLVSFSSLFGYLAAAQHFPVQAVLTSFSVLLLACGAASLNSRQEHLLDAQFERTRNRPVARGSITPARALLQARILLGSGFTILALSSLEAWPLLAAAAAVILYNFCYTPLKYRTIWAIIPGSLCGALPPLIGWLSGGGSPGSVIILAMMVLLSVWQIPHFWLVLLTHRRDYLSGVMPSMILEFDEKKLRLLTVVWVGALVSVTQVLVILLHDQPIQIRWAVSLLAVSVFTVFALFMMLGNRVSYRFLFVVLNLFMFLVMLLFSIGIVNI
jgi:protoheme IX farnesyltransferase